MMLVECLCPQCEERVQASRYTTQGQNSGKAPASAGADKKEVRVKKHYINNTTRSPAIGSTDARPNCSVKFNHAKLLPMQIARCLAASVGQHSPTCHKQIV